MKVDNIYQATEPYMKFIDEYHRETINKKKVKKNKDGSLTTVYSVGIPFNNKIYEVPAYDNETGTIPLNKDGTVNEDEIRKKYIPLLENGSLFKKYGDFGIPKENYETILNLYQLYKQNSNYGKIPEDSIGFYDD